MKVRFWAALWVGKLTAVALKVLRKKGTTLPGYFACKIYPGIIGSLASAFADGTIIITGTNGKTTTNNLLASILEAHGKTVAFNREGANMLTGIAGALLKNTSLLGKAKASILLLEVDEATVPELCRQLTPKLAVVTNFFRDQLDRYGELDTTIKLVKNALPEMTELVLNADDPLVTQIGIDRRHVCYYGVSRLPSSKTESTETREGRYCVVCGRELSYLLFHYGQLGIYECNYCSFKRPAPDIEATNVVQDENGISFDVGGTYQVPLQGYYNLYNALAAFGAARRLGAGPDHIRSGLRNFVSDAGRMEQFNLPGGGVTLTLVKNPTGFNQVIHTLVNVNKPLYLLIAINDLAADGRDISWLWDVDFEVLTAKDDIRQIICSGLRAEDMALRLKYAGFSAEQLMIEREPAKAVDLVEQRKAGEHVYILPTYTVLFPLREILVLRNVEAVKAKEFSA